MTLTKKAASFKRTVTTATLFALAVMIGELTFGNPDFPVTVWYFEQIPAWQWSLPVHLSGFIWLVVCNRLFLARPALVPIMLGALFFLIGETVNWYFLDYFAYAGSHPWQKALSFWIVIAMYAGLCTGAVLMLRIPAGRPETE